MKNILRRKIVSINPSYSHGKLDKRLGLWNLVFFGIASIVGGGSFSTIGQASAHGGPAVIFLFFIIAIVCCLVAFCYADLACRFPSSGSAYTYSYAVLGEIIGWLVAWTLIIEYSIGNIVVAISFSEYLVSILEQVKIPALAVNGIFIPGWLSANYFDVYATYKQALALELGPNSVLPTALQRSWDIYTTAPRIAGIPVILNLPALSVTLLVSYFAYIGIKMTNRINRIMVIIKFAVVAIIVVAGIAYINIDNWIPFAPHTFNQMLGGLSAIFFAYVGFDAISMVTEEAKNPRRDVPKALILSLVLCAITYMVLSLILTGMVPYNELDRADPLAYVFSKFQNTPVVIIVSVGILVSMMNALMAFQVAQPRLLMNMGRDKLIPSAFAQIHPKYKTPRLATICVALAVALPAAFVSFNFAINLTSLGALFVFLMVCLAAIIVHKQQGHSPGGFKIPFINAKYLLVPLSLAFLVYLYTNKWESCINFITNAPLDPPPITFLQDLVKLGSDASEHTVISKAQSTSVPSNVYYSPSASLLQRLPIWIFILTLLASVYYSLRRSLSLIPMLGLLSCLYFAAEMPLETWLQFLIWLLIGMLIYFFYGYRKSALRKL